MDSALHADEVGPNADRSARFNIFRALRLETHEIRHSNFLGWLFDPSESHGQGDLFLRSFVEAIDEARPRGQRIVVGARRSFADAQVSREVDQLDLRIVIPECRVVIAVENKLFTREHSAQLSRYAESIRRDFPDWRHILLYLTLDAETPSDQRWRAFSHREVIRVIALAVDRLGVGTSPEIRAFIQHYIDLIAHVCAQRDSLTKNPRLPEVLQTISGAVLEHEGWTVVAATSSIIECGPTALFEILPSIGVKRGRDPSQWLTLRFHDHGARGYVGRYWRPSDVADLNVRNVILRSLVDAGPITGFKYKNGSTDDALANSYPAFSGDRIQDLRTGTVPEPGLLRDMVHRELRAVDARTDAILRIVQDALGKVQRKPRARRPKIGATLAKS